MSFIRRPYRYCPTSSPVITAWTPGKARAAAVSMPRMRACERVLWTSLPEIMPGIVWSAT